MAEEPARPVALVVGAGDATGGAIARRFARGGYATCVARRSLAKLQPLVEEIRAAGGEAHGFACDARNEDEVAALFDDIEARIGAIEAFVFNIGANVPSSILEETARKYHKIWEMACFAGFLTARQAARCMAPRGKGTILFTGATASLRGSANFAAFAGAKAALRALAQSMAREFQPQGIHVAHVIIDGQIRNDARPGYSATERGEDTVLDPDMIAESYCQLHQQSPSAWTLELDLRPYAEKF